MLSKLRGQIGYLRRHPAYAGPRTVTRLVAWEVRAVTNRPAVVPFAGGQFFCPPERRGMAKLAYIFRDRYEGELATLSRVVQPGMTVLDVGAHYGTYTLVLSRLVGATGHVIAVEPSSRAITVLERNLTLNNIGNVTVVRAAVSDHEGELTLHHHPDPSRTSLADVDESMTAEVVPTVTIDSIAQTAGSPIGFVKIDVEGAESMAFDGAPVVLGEQQPVVLFESAPEAEQRLGLDAGAGWRALQRHGYDAFTLHSEKPTMVDPMTYVQNVYAAPAGVLV